MISSQPLSLHGWSTDDEVLVSGVAGKRRQLGQPDSHLVLEVDDDLALAELQAFIEICNKMRIQE
jgi:hypothetical protein